MIDLYTVKKYSEYDFVQDTLPSSDGTWLCSLTASPYVRGYSYDVVSSVATRIEVVQDEMISDKIHPMIKTVFEWLSNPFYAQRAMQDTTYSGRFDDWQFFPISLSKKWNAYESDVSKYTFTDGVITGLQSDVFQVGDLINIEGALRNNIVGYVTAVSSGSITIDNPNARNTTENAVIFLSDIPKVVESAISQMINWDTFSRQLSDMKSETIGNYSYSKQDKTELGGIDYPSSLVSVLNAYKRLRYVS